MRFFRGGIYKEAKAKNTAIKIKARECKNRMRSSKNILA
jgi:hypothetical protein